MSRLIIDIKLWQADRSAQVVTSLDPLYAFQQVLIKRQVVNPDELHLTFVASGHPDVPLFSRRRVVRTQYDDATEELWRVLRINQTLDGTGPASIECHPLWMDLADHAAALKLSSGALIQSVTITGVSAQAALERILSIDLGCPALFEAGIVDASLAVREVFITAVNASFLDLIKLLAAQLDNAEWYAEWTGAAYQIHLVPRIGDAVATDRLIANVGGTANALQVSRGSDASDYFSAVRPIGGTEGESFSIARADWPVAAAVWNAGTGRTTLSLGGDPVWATGVLVGRKFAGFTIFSTVKPGTVVVTGNASAVVSGRFTEADSSELIDLSDDAAAAEMGSRVRREAFSDTIPAPNLIADAGVSADFSTWPASNSVAGWTAFGGAVIAKNQDELNVRYGTASAHVTADAGAGIQSNLVAWNPTDISPIASALLHARVLSGGLKLEIVDAAGKVYPADGIADSQDDQFAGISISGEKPPAGQLRLRITATAAGSVFVLDAATLTPSGQAMQYAPLMGARALWKEAALLLMREGGVTPDAYDGLVIELNSLDEAYDEIRCGDQVQVELSSVAPFETRVVGIEEELTPNQKVFTKRFSLSRQKADFRKRFITRPAVPQAPVLQSRKVVLPTIKRHYYQVGTTLYAKLTPYDPSGLIERFEYATAVGSNLASGVAYTPKVAEGDGSFLVSAALVAKHNSTIGWRFVLKPPHPAIEDTFTGDSDAIPNASYEIAYRYDAGAAGVIATLVCRGDEDTASFRVTWQRGADQLIQTVNGRTATVDVNTGFPMSTGQAFSILARAYSAVNAGGTAEAQVHNLTYEVPAHENTAIPATHITGQITSVQLGDGAITQVKMASGLRVPVIVSALPALPNAAYPQGQPVLLTTDNKLYRSTGAAWTAEVPATDLTGQIVNGQIANSAVTTDKIGDSQVTTAKIGNNQVTTTKLGDGSITQVKMGSGLRVPVVVSALPALPNAAYPQGQAVLLTTDNKLYRSTGTAWTAEVPAADLTGQISGTQISDNAISTPKLAAGAITTAKLAAGSVTANEIAANTITAGQIAASAIGADEIAAGAIVAGKIAANAVDTAELNAGAVTAAKILAGAITTSKLAAGAVTANEIAANTITAGQIAAGAIGASEIAAGAIVAGKIAAGVITTTELAAGAVTAAKIAAGSITADRLAVTELSSINANLGTVNAGTLNSVTINSPTINAGSGDVTIGADGIAIVAGSVFRNMLRWLSGGVEVLAIYGHSVGTSWIVASGNASLQSTTGSVTVRGSSSGSVNLVGGGGGTVVIDNVFKIPSAMPFAIGERASNPFGFGGFGQLFVKSNGLHFMRPDGSYAGAII